MNVRHSKRLPVLVVGILVLVVLVIGFIYELVSRNIPTKETADLNKVYAAHEGTAALISNGVLSEARGIWKNKQIYLKLSIVQRELNDHFYWDDYEKLLICTTADEIIQADASTEWGSAPVFFQESEREAEEDAADSVYVSLNYVAQYTNIEVNAYSDPPRVFVRTQWGDSAYGILKEDAAIRVEADIKSPVLVEAPAGSRLLTYSQDEVWAKVYSEAGFVGFVQNESFDSTETVTDAGPYQAPGYTRLTAQGPVCLVWHQVFHESGLDTMDSLLANTKGLTVISPTWFSIVSTDGTIESRANQEYVDKAHSRGIAVWALVENINTENKLDNASLLNNTSSRTKLILSLIQEALAYGVDGLNVDLEGLPSSAGAGYIQFIRELSVYCRKHQLVLSVDNYVPSAWTTHYQRDKQSEVVDYLIIMAYDEHYKGSEAGSTASLPFVQDGIEDTIAAGVPAEKIINALPFYTRLWKSDGNSLTSDTISMPKAQEFIQEYAGSTEWQDDVGQNYFEAEIDGVRSRIWVEDASSLRLKLEVMNQYDLAGVAGWKLGMESSDAWDVIAEYLSRQ